jgi:UDP-N-acetylmuramate dehydrogenase
VSEMIADEMRQKIAACMTEPILFEEALSAWTTIRIGGPAEMMVFPKTQEELTQLIILLRAEKSPYVILGAGSNVLVRDGGVRGVVICMNKAFGDIRVQEKKDDKVFLEVGCGVMIPKFLDYCSSQGYAGLESLWGIPGSIGGALFMNAGTREGEIGHYVSRLNILTREGKLKALTGDMIEYRYRGIKLQRGTVIVSAIIELAQSTPEDVKEKQKKFINHRVETQPLKWPNLGSIFKNPESGYVAEMIEEAGLKDTRVGGARISPIHGNFIVNEGEATAKDVLALVGLIKDKVKEKYKVSLETEIKVFGED